MEHRHSKTSPMSVLDICHAWHVALHVSDKLQQCQIYKNKKIVHPRGLPKKKVVCIIHDSVSLTHIKK